MEGLIPQVPFNFLYSLWLSWWVSGWIGPTVVSVARWALDSLLLHRDTDLSVSQAVSLGNSQASQRHSTQMRRHRGEWQVCSLIVRDTAECDWRQGGLWLVTVGQAWR